MIDGSFIVGDTYQDGANIYRWDGSDWVEYYANYIYFQDVQDGYDIQPSDTGLRVTGVTNATVTLPVTGLIEGQKIVVGHKLSGDDANVTINTADGSDIGNSDNDTSAVLWTYGSTDTFYWDGSMWWVIAH